jgi:calcium/calmodulin-dependent protein kinase (CaM kinase) II
VRDLEIVNARLLDAIAAGDKLTYSALVDDSVTCFEPEACGHLARGKTFHKYYFELDSSAEAEPTNSTIVEPLYRVFGDCAVVTYVRLSQRGRATTRTEETRVWQRCAPGSDAALGRWRLVHFHRSAPRNSYG